MSCSIAVRLSVPLSPLLFAAALTAIPGLRTAGAQTVVVQSAPPGSTIELTLNGSTVGSTPADANGDATLTAPARASEALVQIHVDACSNLVRVLLVERGQQPMAPAPGCTRSSIGSVFAMRPVTTFVVD